MCNNKVTSLIFTAAYLIQSSYYICINKQLLELEILTISINYIAIVGYCNCYLANYVFKNYILYFYGRYVVVPLAVSFLQELSSP